MQLIVIKKEYAKYTHLQENSWQRMAILISGKITIHQEKS